MGLSSCVSVYDIEKIVSNHPVYLDSTRKSLVVQTYEYMLNVKYSKTKKQKREKQKKQEELHQTFLQDQESMNEIILEKDMTRILVSMPDDFLKSIDKIANIEQRTRSELIREALRSYMRKSSVQNAEKSERNADLLENLLQ